MWFDYAIQPPLLSSSIVVWFSVCVCVCVYTFSILLVESWCKWQPLIIDGFSFVAYNANASYKRNTFIPIVGIDRSLIRDGDPTRWSLYFQSIDLHLLYASSTIILQLHLRWWCRLWWCMTFWFSILLNLRNKSTLAKPIIGPILSYFFSYQHVFIVSIVHKTIVSSFLSTLAIFLN